MLLPGLPGDPIQVDIAGGETLGKSTRCGSCSESPGDSSGLQTTLRLKPLVTGCLAAEERYKVRRVACFRASVWISTAVLSN